MTSSNLDLFQLVKKLKYEKLFIASERREIEALNRRVNWSNNYIKEYFYS